eukprot:874766-Rhodomonas_salina.1
MARAFAPCALPTKNKSNPSLRPTETRNLGQYPAGEVRAPIRGESSHLLDVQQSPPAPAQERVAESEDGGWQPGRKRRVKPRQQSRRSGQKQGRDRRWHRVVGALSAARACDPDDPALDRQPGCGSARAKSWLRLGGGRKGQAREGEGFGGLGVGVEVGEAGFAKEKVSAAAHLLDFAGQGQSRRPFRVKRHP